MEAGASGTIVNGEAPIYDVLPQVLASIYQAGVYYRPTAQNALRQIDPGGPVRPVLTQHQLQTLLLCAVYPSCSIGEVVAQLNVRSSTARNLLSQA
jgi:hypothetical protein